MLKLSKMCDHALVLCGFIAKFEQEEKPAAEWARMSGVPAATTAKLLKKISSAGLLTSTRGKGGGYKLSKPSIEISVLQVIEAIDGPVAILDCSVNGKGCEHSARCMVGKPMSLVERAVIDGFSKLSLAELVANNGK